MNATIIYIIDERKVLLAKKRRKVGVGFWFGYGGKIDNTETPEENIVRETSEESGGLTISENHLQKVALIDFLKDDEIVPAFRVLFYTTTFFEGVPTTTEEMLDPTWFEIANLPLSEMKPGDELVIPRILNGEKVKGFIRFASDECATLLDASIEACSVEDLVL